MKKLILSLVASALALASVHAAQTIVNIGGSTAGRAAVHANILSVLGGNCTWAYDNVSVPKHERAIYHGTYNSLPITIRTYWSGSVNGITPVVAGNQQTNFFATSVTGMVGGQNVSATGNLAEASADTVQQIGFADIFAGTVAQTAADADEKVGVITFKWYANKGTTRIDNVTPGLIRYLYSSGEAPLSVFTGSSGDTATVYSMGRDSASGTRATAMADSGYGNIETVEQNNVTVVNGAITAITAAGNGGYTSGSSVASRLEGTSSSVVIAYLGASDFVNAPNAVALKWNGVPYSTDGIYNGSYSFWGYLHMNSMSTLAGEGLLFKNALRASIIATPQDAGLLKVNDMNVQRDADGAPIFALD